MFNFILVMNSKQRTISHYILFNQGGFIISISILKNDMLISRQYFVSNNYTLIISFNNNKNLTNPDLFRPSCFNLLNSHSLLFPRFTIYWTWSSKSSRLLIITPNNLFLVFSSKRSELPIFTSGGKSNILDLERSRI